ncbi:Uncharacterized protein TCM_021751 [Theobroma cacao]|uniref:Uncharacterized protein n=1 Tax=Theobroma cacao TaxID=3641 RepID=A0A061ESC0_THECC|nr:Uncharacterized protein TCM_021751 [Theobroma cacao]
MKEEREMKAFPLQKTNNFLALLFHLAPFFCCSLLLVAGAVTKLLLLLLLQQPSWKRPGAHHFACTMHI